MIRFTTLTPPFVLLVALASCSDGTKTSRFLLDPPISDRVVASKLGATELRDVSLPDYAANDEISWQSEDGAVRSNKDILWADNPQRAFTLSLARSISEIAGTTVIPEPWPLTAPPENRLDVRVEKALASNEGFFRLQGRYFLANERAGGNSQARQFDISVPLPDESPTMIARAYSDAITLLAEQISVLGGPGTTIVTRQPERGYLPPLDPIL